MTAPVAPDTSTPGRTRPARSPLPAVAGVGALAAFAAAVVTFGDPLAGARDAAAVAAALASSAAVPAALLVAAYALLAVVVTGRLAARLAAGDRDGAGLRLLPVLGAGHLLLMAAYAAAPAAAVTVGTQILDGEIGPGAAESTLVLMNVAHPLAGWVGAGFLIAVVAAARAAGAPRSLVVVSALLALGLLLPPVGWLVTYLLPLWFAAVGGWLWLRG